MMEREIRRLMNMMFVFFTIVVLALIIGNTITETSSHKAHTEQLRILFDYEFTYPDTTITQTQEVEVQ